MPVSSDRPAVSIILPTYNRAKFLPQAFPSIRSQTFTDWELIVVDDGSTDDTAAVVAERTREWSQPVRYVRQENQGAYGARNTGLDLACGEYVAFFDSDDVWLPEYLERLVTALRRAPDVTWAYCACRIVDLTTGREVSPSTFSDNGRPKPFLRLPTTRIGDLRVFPGRSILDRVIAGRMGLFCGLQNSVIRRTLFDQDRFRTHFRNEAEDVLAALRALARGHRLGYLNEVLVTYSIHAQNSSAACVGGSLDKRLTISRAHIRGLAELGRELPLTGSEQAALARAIGETLFWELGYSLYWRNGYTAEALSAFRDGLREWPWSLRCWKTYAAVGARAALRRAVARTLTP